MLRLLLAVIIVLPLLSSCGLASRFFTTDECEGDTCEAPVLLDNSVTEKKWFCYGNQQDEQWDCLNQKAPEKVSAISAKPQAPRQIETPIEAPIAAPVVAAEPVPELPRVQLPNPGQLDNQLLELPADHYAVQLIALRNLDGVLEYAGLNGIQSPKFVKIKNDDTDWYVLLLDVYPDRAQAEAAKEDWETAKVLRVQPWIRQLGPLQEAILAAQG
tara:strand:- start:40769 stop:41413 length:645 start_codon:yes stop_codon:yes gene_type:complete